MRLRFIAAAAACALLLSPGAFAQPGQAAEPAKPTAPGAAGEARQFTTDEIAADAAYGFCPLFLANLFSLTGPELAERGFSQAISRQQNARFGEIQMVSAKRADGEIAFGGSPGQVCTVIVSGEKRGVALARLHASMGWTGLDFKPAPHMGQALPDVAIHTFKAPVKGQFLVLQLIEVGGATPSVIAQLFATSE